MKTVCVLLFLPFYNCSLMYNTVSTHNMSRDSRSPTATPSRTDALSSGCTQDATTDDTVVTAVITGQNSIAEMRSQIEGLLDETTRREFTNTVNTITRLGNRKPKFVEPRRQKLCDIVTANRQVVQLYNVYATAQVATEKRLTFRLPIFRDLDTAEKIHELGKKGDVYGIEAHAEHEDEINRSLAQLEAETTNQAVQQIVQAQDKDAKNQSFGRQEGTCIIKVRAEIKKEIDGSPALQEAELQGAKTTGQVAQQIGRAQEKDDDMQQKNCDPPVINGDGEINNTPHNDQKNHRRGMLGAMQITDDGAIVNRLRRHQPRKSVRVFEQLSDQTKAPEQLVSPIGTSAADPILRTDQKPSRLTWFGLPTKSHLDITPITNPEAFPLQRIQVVQSHHYPSAKLVGMWTHRDLNGEVIQVTADMQDGPVNHFLIDDARIVTALGLRKGMNDTISLLDEVLRFDETFTIRLLPNQCIKSLKDFVVGRLQPARHAYLYWLDSRGSADPKYGPYVHEARRLANQLGRRALDVWEEIDGF
jgi:hypothetical protein